MIQGRNFPHEPEQANEQTLQELFTRIPGQEIEQFYAAYQLWTRRQQLQAVNAEIAHVQQEIQENSAHMQAVAPSTIALAALVQLQASGVEDVALLDRMLERGDEWLDHAMQLLQRCEQLNMLDEGYTHWCEHALEGAYDWIGSMQEQESTLSLTDAPSSISPLTSTTEDDQDYSVEADEGKIVTEDQLLRKLMSEEGDEITFTESMTDDGMQVTPPEESTELVTKNTTSEEELTESTTEHPTSEEPTSEESPVPASEQLDKLPTQPLPETGQHQEAKTTQPIPVFGLSDEDEMETLPEAAEQEIPDLTEAEIAPQPSVKITQPLPALEHATDDNNLTNTEDESIPTQLNIAETNEAELDQPAYETFEIEANTASLHEDEEEEEQAPSQLDATDQEESSSAPDSIDSETSNPEPAVATATPENETMPTEQEPEAVEDTRIEQGAQANGVVELEQAAEEEQSTQAEPAAEEDDATSTEPAAEEDQLVQTRQEAEAAEVKEGQQWPYVYPEVKETRFISSENTQNETQESNQEASEQKIPVTVGGREELASATGDVRSTEPQPPEQKKQRGLLQRSLAKLLGR